MKVNIDIRIASLYAIIGGFVSLFTSCILEVATLAQVGVVGIFAGVALTALAIIIDTFNL